MRILVTGSRDWTDTGRLGAAIVTAAVYGWPEREAPTPWQPARTGAVVVHGDCPTGADALAQAFCDAHGIATERHPADWSRGRRAGPERNAAMVALGADVCLAFIGPCTSPRCARVDSHLSHGASGCADLAEAAGIPTRRFIASVIRGRAQ